MAAGPLIAIVGPTASGKTDLALELAQYFNGEIIVADSRTIYKGMDIGTAKPTAVEQEVVKHYLLDVIEPGQSFSAAQFKQHALEVIDVIRSRDKLPVLVGGSGMYVDSILFDYEFAPTNSDKDPVNPRHLAPGKSVSRSMMRANTLVIGLDPGQELLVARIEQRIRTMIEGGLIDEAKTLSRKYGWGLESMKTYLPLRGFIEGVESKEQAIEKMVIKDRQLAKKQRTWFRRNKSIHWIESPQEAIKLTTDFLNNQP